VVLETLGNDIRHWETTLFRAPGFLHLAACSANIVAAALGKRMTAYLSRSFCVQNITLDDFLEACVLLLHNCPNFSSQTRSERRS
jgi:hypothetical protein